MTDPTLTAPSRLRASRRSPWWLVAVVIALGAYASVAAADRWTAADQAHRSEQLESLTEVREAHIQATLLRYGDLIANIAAFESGSDAGADGFEEFVATQRLSWLVGFDNAGYFERVGDRVEVRYTAPNPTRLPAGTDMLTHSRRRAALTTAVDTALPAIGPIGVVEAPSEGSNDGSDDNPDDGSDGAEGGIALMEIFMAVYGEGSPPGTVEERRQRHVGWVGLTVDLDAAMASLALEDGGLDIAAYFGDSGELLGESTPGAARRISAADLSSDVTIELVNRPIEVRSAFAPGYASTRSGLLPLCLGLVITGLVAYGVWMTSRNRTMLLEHADAEHNRAELMSSRFLSAVHEAPVGVLVTDTEGKVVLFNERLRTLVGHSGEGEISIFDHLTPEDGPDIIDNLERLSVGETDRLVSERELVRTDGTRVWCRLTVSNTLDHEGRPAGIVAHVQDIANERQATEELRSREQWFASIVEHTRDLIVLMDGDANIKWASPWVGHVYGVEADALRGTSVIRSIHHADQEHVADALRATEPGDTIEVEFRLTTATGETRWMESTATNRLDDPDVAAIISVSRDVTERHQKTQLLAHRASHDALTGLYNRAEMELRMEAAMATAEAEDQPICLAFIDIDRFKQVNDELGHKAGDDVLRQVADAIKAEVRSQDVVARIGGDEMVIGLIGTDIGLSQGIVDRIRDGIRSSAADPNRPRVAVTISVGLARAERGDSVDGLLHRADVALYESKRLGRDRVTVYRRGLDDPGGAGRALVAV